MTCDTFHSRISSAPLAVAGELLDTFARLASGRTIKLISQLRRYLNLNLKNMPYMHAQTCTNMHRLERKLQSNCSDSCTQPVQVIFHPIWFMCIFLLCLSPPSSSFLQSLLQFLPLACLVHCLGPLCVRMLMTIIYLTGFTGCNYKEFMISALTCFHNLYSQLYGIYLYQVGICDSLHYFWQHRW